ncbi:hypothetical protein ACWGI8_34690 [Streptomyces sp. NPDC054841]
MVSLSQEEAEVLDQAAVALLDNPFAWRLRAIERIELESALWSDRKREIHVKPLVTALREYCGDGDEIKKQSLIPARSVLEARSWSPFKDKSGDSALILPITDMPTIPVLDLKITVNGKEVYRIPLDESARIQAKYIVRMAERVGLPVVMNGLPERFVEFLTCVFYFPPSPYEKVWRKYHHLSLRTFGHWERRNEVDEIREHLNSIARDADPALDDFTMEIIEEFYLRWRDVSREIGRLAGDHSIAEYLSGAKYPLLALPYFFQELRAKGTDPPSGDEVLQLLTALRDLLNGASDIISNPPSGDVGEARKLLETYFSYGMRWVAFARCTVPPDESFIITVSHRRAVYFTKTRDEFSPLRDNSRKTAYTLISFADAETNHVSVRVADTTVRLHRPEARDALGNRFKPSQRVDEEVRTFELYFRQDSTRDRPKRIWIRLPLRLTRLNSCMLWLTMFITAFGILLLSVRGAARADLTAKDATVILVPVAFTAALLLARDSSTLSMRVRQVRQAILLAELFVLLAMAFVLVLIHYIHDPMPPGGCPLPYVFSEWCRR